MRTLAIANAKGGTGKTTVAVHLAAGLARQGKRVLLVDLDAQANATTWLLGLEHGVTSGTAEALLAKRIGPEHLQQVPTRENMALLTASNALATSEALISSRPVAHLTLRRALRDVASSFDFAILDTAGEAGFYVVSALCASDAVLAPVPAAYLSLAGLRRLEELVGEVREGLETDTRLLGYVLFAADQREAITAEAREMLGHAAGAKLLKTEIRVSTAAKALPARRATAWDDGADDRGRDDYARLLLEVLRRLEALGRRS